MEPRGEGEGEGKVLSLHQIQTVRTCNDYMDSFPARTTPDHATDVGEGSPHPSEQRVAGSDKAVQEQPRSLAITSGSSEQRGLGNVVETEEPIQDQPQEARKLLEKDGKAGKRRRKHPCPCQRCGRCRCKDCSGAKPRPLPSCWLCGGRCLCSPEATVDYATCACCLKAVLYHCSNDDEDASSDAPFSCRKSRRCTRWSTIAALTLILPCLLCYAPAKGCVALCQLCHDRAQRTGCRCDRVQA